MNDPFATAPAEEAQTELPDNPLSADAIRAAKPAIATAYVDVKPRLADGFPFSEGKIVTTFKAGAGYDQPWIVIHANSVAESDALLDQSLADYMAKVKKVASHFNGGGGKPNPAPAQSSQPLQPGQPAGSTQPPSWMPPPPDETWVYKTGFKNGNTWHAWAPAQKGGGEWQFHRAPK